MNITIVSYLLNSSPSICSTDAKGDLTTAIKDISAFWVVPEQALFTKSCLKDRALNYGDGCFTTMYGEFGSLFLFDEHFQRLARDCQKLSIELCLDTVQQWLFIGLKHLLNKNSNSYAVKVLVSRGVGGRGYDLPVSSNTSVIVSIFETQKIDIKQTLNDEYGFAIKQSSMTLATQALLAGIKHLNRLEQILAKRELHSYHTDKWVPNDLLLCDQAGNMIEATAANVFYHKNGVWFTPSTDSCGVDGVMRNAVLAYFKTQGLKYEVRAAPFSDLYNADGIFLCNAIKFIIPVSSVLVNNDSYHVDTSQAGAISIGLYEHLSTHYRLQFET